MTDRKESSEALEALASEVRELRNRLDGMREIVDVLDRRWLAIATGTVIDKRFAELVERIYRVELDCEDLRSDIDLLCPW